MTVYLPMPKRLMANAKRCTQLEDLLADDIRGKWVRVRSDWNYVTVGHMRVFGIVGDHPELTWHDQVPCVRITRLIALPRTGHNPQPCMLRGEHLEQHPIYVDHVTRTDLVDIIEGLRSTGYVVVEHHVSRSNAVRLAEDMLFGLL